MSREIEARLKLSAVDRTAAAFKSVSGRMSAIDAKARAVSAASSRMSSMQAAMVARAAGVLAPVALGAAAKRAYADYAETDRRLTRIGITADASAEAVAAMRGWIASIAQETATPLDEVTGGLEDLVSQGRSLGDSLSFLPSVARTAAASGSAVKDIAATAGALSDSLGIAGDRMQAAFDIIVAGGKAGKFETKDMSQYLQALAPAAAAVGLKGEAGLRRLTAMLQMTRNQTGDAASAATNLQNVFAKMESDETAKKFSKFGVDLRKEMAKARREGKDLTEVFLDLSERALKGDLSKVPQLFADMQVAGGMRALLSQRDTLRKLEEALAAVDGTTLTDFAKVADDAKAAVDRLGNSWDRFVVNAGRSLHNAGLTAFLDKLSEGMDRQAKVVEAEQKAPGGGRDERIRQMVERGVPFDEAEKLVRADETWVPFTKGRPTTSERRRADIAAAADLDRAEAALAAAERTKGGLYGYRSALDERALNKARARVAGAREAAGRVYPSADYGATPGLPAAELDQLRRSGLPQPRPALPGEVGGITPMPRARPDPFEIPVQLDDASLDSEVLRLRARLQSNLDANPLVLRARVDTSGAGGLNPGRSFSGGNFTGAP